jgi:hypothetical protein
MAPSWPPDLVTIATLDRSGHGSSGRHHGLWTTERLWITSLDQEALDHEVEAVAELEAGDAEPDPDFDSVDPDFDGLASDVDLPEVRDSEPRDSEVRDSEVRDSEVRDSDLLSAPDSDLPLALLDSDLP